MLAIVKFTNKDVLVVINTSTEGNTQYRIRES
jgi:hypothetical protein